MASATFFMVKFKLSFWRNDFPAQHVFCLPKANLNSWGWCTIATPPTLCPWIALPSTKCQPEPSTNRCSRPAFGRNGKVPSPDNRMRSKSICPQVPPRISMIGGTDFLSFLVISVWFSCNFWNRTSKDKTCRQLSKVILRPSCSQQPDFLPFAWIKTWNQYGQLLRDHRSPKWPFSSRFPCHRDLTNDTVKPLQSEKASLEPPEIKQLRYQCEWLHTNPSCSTHNRQTVFPTDMIGSSTASLHQRKGAKQMNAATKPTRIPDPSAKVRPRTRLRQQMAHPPTPPILWWLEPGLAPRYCLFIKWTWMNGYDMDFRSSLKGDATSWNSQLDYLHIFWFLY